MLAPWHRIIVTSLLLPALGVASPVESASGQAANAGPSFSCSGRLPTAEEVICNDAELSAYDRAMAWAYSHKWTTSAVDRADQQLWLARRNACADRRDCIFAAYHEWIAGLDAVQSLGRTFDRVAKADNRGDDPMLESWRSPTGSVTVLGGNGSLFVHSLGGGWYLFQANSTHFYDPHDSLGPNASTSEAVGLVQLTSGKGLWVEDPGTDESCKVQLVRLSSKKWMLVEAGATCGGIGSTLTGVYSKP